MYQINLIICVSVHWSMRGIKALNRKTESYDSNVVGRCSYVFSTYDPRRSCCVHSAQMLRKCVSAFIWLLPRRNNTSTLPLRLSMAGKTLLEI